MMEAGSSQGDGRASSSSEGAPRRAGGGGLERLVAAGRDEERRSSDGAGVSGGVGVRAVDRDEGSQGVPQVTSSYRGTVEGQPGGRERGAGKALAPLETGGAGADDGRCVCRCTHLIFRSRTVAMLKNCKCLFFIYVFLCGCVRLCACVSS